MGGFRFGPLVMSAPRFYGVVALVVLVVAGEVLARIRRRPQVAIWAWSAALIVAVGSRLGFVLVNLPAFAGAPWRIVAFWQGGFSPWWGVVAAAAFTVAWALRRPDARAPVAAAAALGLAAWLLVPLALAPAGPAGVGLPDVSVQRLGGEPVRLADLKGEPVVLNLWATWCPPCRRELPMLERAAAAHPEVHFLLASQGESEATVRAYVEKEGLGLPNVLIDPPSVLSRALDALGYPTSLFFDASGALVRTQIGELSDVTLANELAALAR